MSPLLLGATAVFLTGAAWQDWREGRVRNVWTLPFLAGFVLYHVGTQTVWLSVAGLVGCGLVSFWPAWKGRWGVGDLKLCAALGAAIGFLPAMIAWLAGLSLAPLLAPWIRRGQKGTARGLPGAVLVWVPGLVVLVLLGWGR